VSNISQGTVATHLSYGRINDGFSRKLIAESENERISKINQYLVKLEARLKWNFLTDSGQWCTTM